MALPTHQLLVFYVRGVGGRLPPLFTFITNVWEQTRMHAQIGNSRVYSSFRFALCCWQKYRWCRSWLTDNIFLPTNITCPFDVHNTTQWIQIPCFQWHHSSESKRFVKKDHDEKLVSHIIQMQKHAALSMTTCPPNNDAHSTSKIPCGSVRRQRESVTICILSELQSWPICTVHKKTLPQPWPQPLGEGQISISTNSVSNFGDNQVSLSNAHNVMILTWKRFDTSQSLSLSWSLPSTGLLFALDH